MSKLSHILAENMRRFGTKNLNEQDQIKFDTIKPVKGKDDIDNDEEEIILGKSYNAGYNFAIREVPAATEEDSPRYIIQYQDASNPNTPFVTPKMYTSIYTNNGKGWETKEEAKKILQKHLLPTTSYESTISNWSDAQKETETKKLEKQKEEIEKKLDQLENN